PPSIVRGDTPEPARPPSSGSGGSSRPPDGRGWCMRPHARGWACRLSTVSFKPRGSVFYVVVFIALRRRPRRACGVVRGLPDKESHLTSKDLPTVLARAPKFLSTRRGVAYSRADEPAAVRTWRTEGRYGGGPPALRAARAHVRQDRSVP